LKCSQACLSSSKLVAFRRRPRIAPRPGSFKLTRRHYGRRVLLSWSSPAFQSWRRNVPPYCLSDPSVWFRRKIQRATLRCFVPTLVRGAHSTAVSPRLWRSCRVLPERLRRPSRATAAFVRFCTPTTCPITSALRWRARQRPPPSTFQRPWRVLAPTIFAPIAQSLRSWGSPFEAFPSHFVPPAVAFGTRAVPPACLSARRWPIAHLPFRGRASRRKIRGETHPIRLLGLAPSESSTTACDLRRMRSAAPLGFASLRISPSPLRARFHGPSALGLTLLLVFRRRLPLSVLLCGEVGFPSQRFWYH
jgi:hypothetical protein